MLWSAKRCILGYVECGFIDMRPAVVANNDSPVQVKQFCRSFRELKSMGFDLPSIVGALVLHKQDLAAATDACLTAQ